MKVGVFGAGSIGCWLGGKLIAAGHDVVLVGRLGKELTRGLELTDFSGARTVVERGRLHYVDDASALSDREAVLVTTKSAATAEAGATIARVTSSSCVVASFQNGVTNANTLRAALPNRVVLAGMVPFNVVNKGNGHFHNGTSGPLELERGAPDLVRALVGAGFGVVEHDDLRPVQWSKLLVNLNNALNALSGLPLRDQLSIREWRLLMAQLVREGLASMRAAGMKPVRIGKLLPSLAPFALSLPNWLFFRVASAMVKIDPEARSSMWEDLERRRHTEVDELNGAIVALGAKHNVATPLNARVVALLHEAERNHAGSPKLAANQITTT